MSALQAHPPCVFLSHDRKRASSRAVHVSALFGFGTELIPALSEESQAWSGGRPHTPPWDGFGLAGPAARKPGAWKDWADGRAEEGSWWAEQMGRGGGRMGVPGAHFWGSDTGMSVPSPGGMAGGTSLGINYAAATGRSVGSSLLRQWYWGRPSRTSLCQSAHSNPSQLCSIRPWTLARPSRSMRAKTPSDIRCGPWGASFTTRHGGTRRDSRWLCRDATGERRPQVSSYLRHEGLSPAPTRELITEQGSPSPGPTGLWSCMISKVFKP